MDSAETAARKLMKALVRKGCSVGKPLVNAELQQIAVEAGIDDTEQIEVLEAADVNGWLDEGIGGAGVVITAAGSDVGNA